MIKAHPRLTDFEMIQDFIAKYQNRDREQQWTHSELRQYLSLAYSNANDCATHRWKGGWRWEHWLKKHQERISGAVSLNYDLTLETTLDKMSLRYYRIGSKEEDAGIGIPIFKPHGSCDFDISSRAIYMPPEIRLKNLTFLNDSIIDGRGRIEIVPKQKFLEPRIESDIVLPFESSPQTQLTWVRQGYEAVNKLSKTISTCIIVGVSYQPCDRREIDYIGKALPTNTTIRVIDPEPNADLVATLNTISDNVKTIHPEYLLDNVI